MNSQDAVLRIEGLTKEYRTGFFKQKRVCALQSLKLEVFRGEVFGFLGPNGAGKTTTLKLLMRLIYPTSGTAFILGRPFEDVATRSRIGFLPENPYFYDYLSGIEFLEYTASLFGIPRNQRRRKAEEMLEKVGLGDERGTRQLRKYSKGMLQRIGIAQALINDPEVIFLDEPMSGLDPIGRKEVRDLMLSLRHQGKTIFFSSHILTDVEAICDRAAIMNRGNLMRCGTIEELRGRQQSSLEIVAMGVSKDTLEQEAAGNSSILSVVTTPGGVQVVVPDESCVEEAVSLIRRCGGKLVSVNSSRTSLEDVFFSTNSGE